MNGPWIVLPPIRPLRPLAEMIHHQAKQVGRNRRKDPQENNKKIDELCRIWTCQLYRNERKKEQWSEHRSCRSCSFLRTIFRKKDLHVHQLVPLGQRIRLANPFVRATLRLLMPIPLFAPPSTPGTILLGLLSACPCSRSGRDRINLQKGPLHLARNSLEKVETSICKHKEATL
jgi:hypothetical protein